MLDNTPALRRCSVGIVAGISGHAWKAWSSIEGVGRVEQFWLPGATGIGAFSAGSYNKVKEASGYKSDRYIWRYVKPSQQSLTAAIDELDA